MPCLYDPSMSDHHFPPDSDLSDKTGGGKRYTSFITVIYFLKYVSRNEGRAVYKHFSNIFLNKKMNCPRSFKMFIGEYLVPSGLWHS